MSHFKPNYFQRRSRPQGPKSNQQIRAIDVQVIGSDGNNVGILTLKKAIELAKGEGLDLIEVMHASVLEVKPENYERYTVIGI